MKYNKKDIRKWIKALRSGKYKQGKASLQSAEGFCCLGVACDIFIPQDKKILSGANRMTGTFPNYQLHAPEWLKKINNDFAEKNLIEIGGFQHSTSISDMNDNFPSRNAELQREHFSMNFDEIADMIQLVYLEGAFDGQA